jgi:hypothetical protein
MISFDDATRESKWKTFEERYRNVLDSISTDHPIVVSGFSPFSFTNYFFVQHRL